MKWVRTILVAASAALLAPAAASAALPNATRHVLKATQAQLAFATGNGASDSIWLANANGSGRRRLGRGDGPLLAPDAMHVAASLYGNSGRALAVYTPGAATHSYFNVANVSVTAAAWSPDSRYLAVEVFGTSASGAGSGLAVIDTTTWSAKTVASGGICGASFAPTLPARLVYARGPNNSFCQVGHVNVYTVNADGTGRRQLTNDGRSLNPVWGSARIAFDRGTARKNDAPIFQIWLMNPDGTHRSQLTHMKIPTLVSGLVPIQFSADGKRLLTEFEGQDTIGAWVIALSGGKPRELKVKNRSVRAAAISQDGTAVLVDTGFDAPPSQGNVDLIPFGGGAARVLVGNAGEPSWNL